MTSNTLFEVLHLIGLVLWAGYIPCENLLFFVAWDSRVIEERRRAMAWVVHLTNLQEIPGIVLVVISGMAMAFQQGERLLAEPWFRAKLLLLIVLAASEAMIIHRRQSALARYFAETPPDAVDEAAVRRTLRWIVVGGLTSLASLFGIVLLAVGKDVPPPAVWSFIPAALAMGGVFLLVLRRVAVGVRGVLPDA